MEPFWGVIIGTAIGGLILEIGYIIKGHTINSETRGYAVASIILGLLVIIPFGSFIGLILGIASYQKTKWRKLSVVGIVICSIATLLWALLILDRILQ